jgi:site-specific DNA-methyltransferase (adenine-specific)
VTDLPINQIICGDCLEVMRDWPGKCVDLVLTDPPYGHNNNNGDLIARREEALGKGESPKENYRPIANDGVEANDLFKASLTHWYRLLHLGDCCCCCCGGGGPDPQFGRWSLWMDEVFQFKQMVVWDKGPMGMGWHYRRSYETVLVGEVPGAACKWYGGREVENIIRPGAYGIRKIIPSTEDHPTPKPVELALHFIRIHSEPGDIVLDPFCGHGWVCVAAKLLGRRYIGIDISPEYCGIARERLAAVETGVPVKERRAGQKGLFDVD